MVQGLLILVVFQELPYLLGNNSSLGKKNFQDFSLKNKNSSSISTQIILELSTCITKIMPLTNIADMMMASYRFLLLC